MVSMQIAMRSRCQLCTLPWAACSPPSTSVAVEAVEGVVALVIAEASAMTGTLLSSARCAQSDETEDDEGADPDEGQERTPRQRSSRCNACTHHSITSIVM